MGQGASRHAAEQPSSSPSSSLSSNRRPNILQRRTNNNDSADDLDHGLLNVPPRPRRTRAATNRLSQIFRPNHSSAADSDVENGPIQQPPSASVEHSAPARSETLVRRTRSRFQEMLHRNSSSTSHRPPFIFRHFNGSSYVRSESHHRDHVDEDDMFQAPRLPSIDMSATFDSDPTFGSHVEPVLTARSEASSRGTARRLHAFRPDRPLRQLTSSLRRRRSPDPSASISSLRPSRNEDQATLLSQLLSVAAAATAATLMGDDHNALREARSLTGSAGLGGLGGNGEDGSFDGFLRALQNGRIASALRQGGSDGEGESGNSGAPLNFFRMFRFGAQPAEPADPANSDGGSQSENGEGRMVPIIIVGIRSISPNSSSGPGSPSEDLPPFINALGNFPTPLPAHALGRHGHDSIDSILRPPQNGTSFRHRRRASMGGFGLGRSRLSDRMDDQRDHRSPDRRRERPWSMASSSSTYEPRPPPATPASPSPELSRIASRSTTPSHSRPTSLVANSMRDLDLSRRNSLLHRSAASPLSSHTEETSSIHSSHSATGLLGDVEPYRVHRRSDTTPNVHYPRFASGHPRRNGVVEPDNLPPLSRSSTTNTDASNDQRHGGSDSRSWIIYVLGGSYPENHPIVTTPSLFTENPTYEDMMLLSALLGPARAPVATDEDVQNAGGVYNIEPVELSEDAAKTVQLVAKAVEGDDQVLLEQGHRCLVCLCDFETSEVARKLVKCKHLFHKECIDQWLTTGRNSCPLCREQGVDEKEREASAEEDSEQDGSSRSSGDTVAGAELPHGLPAELEGS